MTARLWTKPSPPGPHMKIPAMIAQISPGSFKRLKTSDAIEENTINSWLGLPN